MQEKRSMRSAIPTAVLLWGLAAAQLIAAPALAEYGAIARDEGADKSGASWRQPTQQRADEVAISECGTSGCKVVIRAGPGMCGALATTDNGKGMGASSRKDRDAARLASLKGCQKDKKGECTVRFSDCNK
jgi:hypothetical protein